MKTRIVNLNRPDAVETRADARAHAWRSLESSACELMRAFNLTDDARFRYTWDAATRERVRDSFIEIMQAFEHGRIELRKGAVAQDDVQLQRFMREVQTPAKSFDTDLSD